MKKRIISGVLAGLVTAATLSACGATKVEPATAATSAPGAEAASASTAAAASAAEAATEVNENAQATTEAAAANNAAASGDDVTLDEALNNEIRVKPDSAKWTINLAGNNGSLCNVPTFLAFELGFFADEGIDATLTSADFQTKSAGLDDGSFPIINDDYMFFKSVENGIGASIVDGIHKGCIKVQVLPDSDLAKPEDFAGKNIRIACDEIGGTTYQATALWLEQAGIKAFGSDAEVTFVPYNDDNLSIAALEKGEVQAVADWDPVAAIAEKEGRVKTILDIAKDDPFKDHYCCYLYASDKVLDEDPALIAAILRAYHRAEDWTAKHPEDATEIITQKNYVQIDDKELAVSLISEYGYPLMADRESGNTIDLHEDVSFFVTELTKIGILEGDADAFSNRLVFDVDINL